MTEDSFKDKERYVSHQARYPQSMDEDYVPRKEYDLLRQKLLEAAKEETEKKAKELKNKKTSFRTGFLAGGAVVGVIAALFYQSCQGNGGNSSTSHNDAGAAPDASYDQTDHSGCYPPRRKELEELQKKLVTCETDRDSYKSKLAMVTTITT